MKNNKYLLIAAGLFVLSALLLKVPCQASGIEDAKKRMTGLKSSIDYLGSRHVDTADFLKKYAEIEKDIAEYDKPQTEGLLETNETLVKVIILNIEGLDKQVADKTRAVDRLDILYLVMLVFGVVTGAGFGIYIVVMYNKRK